MDGSIGALLGARLKADVGRRHFLKGLAGLGALSMFGPADGDVIGMAKWVKAWEAFKLA